MNADELTHCTDEELARVDPVVMNQEVAKGIPALAGLDVSHYQRPVDLWAADITRQLPNWEQEFRRSPQDWSNDIHRFRLGVVCYYIDRHLGICYNEDQRHVM